MTDLQEWKYLSSWGLSASESLSQENDLSAINYLNTHSYSTLRYAHGKVKGINIGDITTFEASDENNPVPIKMELTLISKLFKFILDNNLAG